jgi:hypothetical protein
MAAKSRIDDPRMMKVKKGNGDEYHCSTFSVREREKMSGLPIGYCEVPLNNLYNQLTEDAFLKPENAGSCKTYKDFLDKTLWHFAKKCKFAFKGSNDPPFFQIEISAPPEGRKEVSYFDEKEYCKHLIGNGKSIYSVLILWLMLDSLFLFQSGWSLPVVEHLLEVRLTNCTFCITSKYLQLFISSILIAY